MKNYSIDTKCVQAGYEPKSGESRIPPICASTTFKYDTVSQLGDLFDLNTSGHFYTRLSNPTAECVEKKAAELEGGIGALMTSSGQAATLTAILNICKSGDHIISSSEIYGGTFNLFAVTLKKLGIDFTFVSVDSSEDEIESAVKDNTRLVFGESLSNPAVSVMDIEKFARVAHNHGIPLIVDNTFPTPINCRPFEWGADIVVHSTSKYMDGHASVLGGMLIDSGKFDWTNGKFPELTTPDESYHGVIYTEHFGEAAFIAKARTQLMRDMGVTPSPFSAFILNMNLETLALRMRKHCDNAQKVAEYLEAHPKIDWVNFPGLKSAKYYELAQKYLPDGSSGVMSFGVKGGKEASVKAVEALNLAAIVTHVADTRTCVLHPATSTHRQLSDEQLLSAGITPELIRLSVGIENPDDIINDFDNALKNV